MLGKARLQAVQDPWQEPHTGMLVFPALGMLRQEDQEGVCGQLGLYSKSLCNEQTAGGSEVAPGFKAFAAEPGDLSLISGVCTAEENPLP